MCMTPKPPNQKRVYTHPLVKYCDEDATIPLVATAPLAIGKQTTAAAGCVTTATGTEAAHPEVSEASFASPLPAEVGEK